MTTCVPSHHPDAYADTWAIHAATLDVKRRREVYERAQMRITPWLRRHPPGRNGRRYERTWQLRAAGWSVKRWALAYGVSSAYVSNVLCAQYYTPWMQDALADDAGVPRKEFWGADYWCVRGHRRRGRYGGGRKRPGAGKCATPGA